MIGYSSSEFVNETRVSASKKFFIRMRIDLPLLISLLFLVVVGLFVFYSASNQGDDLPLGKQISRLTISFVVMILFAQISPNTLRHWSPWLYLTGVFMLILVLFFGDIGKGAQRWLNIGGIKFQPSELLKLAGPMMVAWYLSNVTLPPRTKHTLAAAVLIFIPAILVAKQPDLGTAIILVASGLFVLFLAGLSIRFIVISAVIMIPLVWLYWQYGMLPYQKARVLIAFNPESDPTGRGWNIIQSKIAIGSGGTYGKGWLNGSQSHLDFLPEPYTDFIFSVLAEEFGFLGTLFILTLYIAIIVRCLSITLQAQDTYSRLLAGSITLTFFLYIFINIGMVSGILPVVGVPLPMISYGGTSMVSLMAGFGILMSIQTHRKLMST